MKIYSSFFFLFQIKSTFFRKSNSMLPYEHDKSFTLSEHRSCMHRFNWKQTQLSNSTIKRDKCRRREPISHGTVAGIVSWCQLNEKKNVRKKMGYSSQQHRIEKLSWIARRPLQFPAILSLVWFTWKSIDTQRAWEHCQRFGIWANCGGEKFLWLLIAVLK